MESEYCRPRSWKMSRTDEEPEVFTGSTPRTVAFTCASIAAAESNRQRAASTFGELEAARGAGNSDAFMKIWPASASRWMSECDEDALAVNELNSAEEGRGTFCRLEKVPWHTQQTHCSVHLSKTSLHYCVSENNAFENTHELLLTRR